MKRYFKSGIPLIIFLSLISLLLTACTSTSDSVPAGPVSPPLNQTIPPESSTPPESSGVSRPNTTPESGEPYVAEPFSGLWQYEYGDRNFAQIRVYNETEEGFDFHLFVVEYDQGGAITLGGFSTNARKGSDGKALYSAGQKESSNTLRHVDGNLNINNVYLNITYENVKITTDNYRTQLPTTFERIPANQTQQALSRLPFFTREIIDFPFDLTIEEADKFFGPLLDVVTSPEHGNSTQVIMNRKYADTTVSFYFPEGAGKNYFFISIETAHPGLSFVRDIQVGDSLESVIAKFPDERNEFNLEHKQKILYGKAMHLQTYGYIWYGWYEKNELKNIWYSDGRKIFKLEFDASDHVSKMTISNAS